MTILWDNEIGAAERYAFAIGVGVTTVENASSAARTLAADPDEQLIVIGPDVDLDGACTLIETSRVERPEAGVILLRRRLDVSVLGQALRAGAREVVAADELANLADACRRSLELTDRLRGHAGSAGETSGRIVTVFSAKGGVGKTTFSTNLGAYLAASGHRTLVIDLDLAFGDVGISLQLLPTQTMEEVVAMTGHLDEQGLRSVVTSHPSGLDVLCAPSGPGGADRIPGVTVSEVLRVARRHYEFVIIDTPPAFTDHVLAAFDLSDILVLIATLDIPALKNLRLTLDTLDLLGNPRESRVVVLNRSDAKVGLRSEDVVTSIKQDIAIMVPGSVDVPASVNRGVVIVLDDPRHPVSVAIKELADRHIRQLPDPVGRRGHRTTKRLMSWGAKK